MQGGWKSLKMVFNLRGISRMTGIFYSLGPCQWKTKLPARPQCTVSCSGLKLRLIKYLFVHTVFLGEVNHRLDIFRLCLIKERPIAHDKTTAFASSVNEFLAVSFHFIGRG
jgi:hypothetical protein